MPIREKFRNLKNLDLRNNIVSLAIIKEYKRQRISHYDVKYVQINESLENRLRNIIINKINNSNSFEEYTLDCPEPEGELVRTINYNETDFFRIYENLINLNPEENIIESVDELIKAKSYLIILRNNNNINVIGFKILPENWKMKKQKGLIPLLYKENRFEDLEDETIFSISNMVDFIYYDEYLFILSKKAFERGLNFREGMKSKAQQLYTEFQDLNLFVNLDILVNKVGDNLRYLRKVATIKNLGYYRNENFLNRLKQINETKGWGINFNNNQIVITEDTLDTILTILQNKRLHSELSEEDFDVDNAKKIES